MASDDDDEFDEAVVCSSCEETPELFYEPTSDAAYQLRCGCDMTSVDVSDPLNESAVTEMTGKWSNLDVDSTMRYGDS